LLSHREVIRMFRKTACVGLFLTGACVHPVVAQQQPQDQNNGQSNGQGGDQNSNQGPEQSTPPIPAYKSPMASAADNGAQQETQELTPDTRPLSGVQNLSLGIAMNHSYWQPFVSVSATADSNPNETAGNTEWGAWAAVYGGVDLYRNSSNSMLALNYLSGGMFSNVSTVGTGVVQELGFSDRVNFRRWSIALFDQFAYLPESSFGFGTGDLSAPGGGASGLGPGFGSGQSLLTGFGQNISNSSFLEVDRYLSRRSSLTFAGGYTLLDYLDNSSLLTSGDVVARAGYNYQATRKDTVAVFYTFNGIRYSGFDQSINTHTVQVSYARRVTGRLAFQVAAGPEFVFSRFPLELGTGTGGEGETPTESSFTQVTWALNTSLTYAFERSQLGLSYNHGVYAGSGVLAGSVADTAAGSFVRQVSRSVSAGVNSGYSHNEGVSIFSGTATNQTYDYWFANANMVHPIGRTFRLTLAYEFQYQTSNEAFCFGPSCGTSLTRNLITVGVGWISRPLSF
jgi:hypothetical protein